VQDLQVAVQDVWQRVDREADSAVGYAVLFEVAAPEGREEKGLPGSSLSGQCPGCFVRYQRFVQDLQVAV
jgi:hypothetical protein